MASGLIIAISGVAGIAFGYGLGYLVHVRPARANTRRHMAIQRKLHDARRVSLPHDHAGPSRQSKIRPQRRES
jgi:hypothetical protein